MFSDHPGIITKSARLRQALLAVFLLIVCAFPTDVFAKDSRSSSSSSSSKPSVPETDKAEALQEDLEESQALDHQEDQTVQAENYKRAWDDAMIAAPAFGD